MKKTEGLFGLGFLGLAMLFVFGIGGCEEGSILPPEIYSVTVSPASVNVKKGNEQNFSATVTGKGSFSRRVVWSIVENSVHSGTTIDEGGLLKVSAEETLNKLTVRATSASDRRKNGGATVAVISIYTVTFDPNGGTGMTPLPLSVAAGESITIPADGLTKDGFAFTGWTNNAAGTGTIFRTEAIYTPGVDTILYAKWEAVAGIIDTYYISFDPNKGSGMDSFSFSVAAGESITLPTESNLTRDGFTFAGWTNNAAGTGIVHHAEAKYTPGGNVTLYASWNITVTFNLNGSEGTVPADQIIMEGLSITLPSGSDLSKDDYTFGGWNTKMDGTGDNYNASSSYTPTSNITLYARWVIIYTVSFNANGGSGTVPNKKVNAGDSITLPSGSGLTRTGYVFSGWNTQDDGMGTNYDADDSYTVTGDITLYARWYPAYTVRFNANGGSGTAPGNQIVHTEDSITLPSGSSLTKTGYVFSGWNTSNDGTGTNYNAGSSYTPTNDITLYAKWDLAYTVSFNANGGSGTVPDNQIVHVGNSITLPSGSSLTRTGYVFGGWNISSDGTGTNYNAGSSYTPANDITLYARWYYSGDETDPIPLTINTWADGVITSTASNSAVWYSFNVTSGTTYYVWWNDTDAGSSKTLDIKVSAYSNGTSIFMDQDSGWTNPQSFTANSNTVKIKVEPYSSGSAGTFAVAYSISSTRPTP